MYLIKERILNEWIPIGFFTEALDRDEAFLKYVLPQAKINKTWVMKEDDK